MAHKKIKKMRGDRPHLRALLPGVMFAGMMLPAYGAQPTGEAIHQQAQYDYAIPAGSLSDALTQFSTQSHGIQLMSPLSMLQGHKTAGLHGHYAPQDALAALLAGSGMAGKFYNATSFVVYPQPAANTKTSASNVLGAVTVEGSTSQVSGGVNGSTDVTATENSGSYTSNLMTIGSKSPQSIKDTPQSVSVLTNKQLTDQHIDDFSDAMQHMAGVTTVQGSDSGQTTFYSRAMPITQIQIDGGAPMNISDSAQLKPNFDMSMYDHVEVLRGVDGLFNGNGQSSGVVNLVRKRPLDHQQVSLTSSVGSWNDYRNVLDASSPLGFDGALRGRMVLTWQKKDYFYKGANDDKKIIYGNLEGDITPDTQWRIGGSYTDDDALPWRNGLPRYADGRDLDLPRSFSMVTPWSYDRTKTMELFTQLDHQFNDDWSLHLNLNHMDQKYASLGSSFTGAIDDQGNGLTLIANKTDYRAKEDGLDGSLNGGITLWGEKQSLVIGGNYSRTNSIGYSPTSFYEYDNPDGSVKNVNIFGFNPNDWSAPVFTGDSTKDDYQERQTGLYAKITITPWKPLHLMTGYRYNNYRNNYLLADIQQTPYAEREANIPYYAVSFDLTPHWTTYVSYTNIFQSQAGLHTSEGAPLKPITGTNKETGLKYSDGKLNVSLSLYHLQQKNNSTLTDISSWLTGDQSCCYANIKATQVSKGVDFEISGALTDYWQVAASYNYNRNYYVGDDGPGNSGQSINTQSPEHQFKIWNSYQLHGSDFLQRWRIGGGVIGQSEYYQSADGQCDITGTVCYPGVTIKQGFYSVVSAFTSYQINKNWSAQFNINNLFDRRYYQTISSTLNGNWYGEPRSFRLTLSGIF